MQLVSVWFAKSSRSVKFYHSDTLCLNSYSGLAVEAASFATILPATVYDIPSAAYWLSGHLQKYFL